MIIDEKKSLKQWPGRAVIKHGRGSRGSIKKSSDEAESTAWTPKRVAVMLMLDAPSTRTLDPFHERECYLIKLVTQNI